MDRARVGRFVGLVWGGALLFGLLAVLARSLVGPLGVQLVTLGAGWVPFVAAALLGGRGDLSSRLGLETPNRWILVAWLLPWGLLIPVVGLSVLFGGWSDSLGGLLGVYATGMPPEQLRAVQADLASLPVHPALLALLPMLLAGPTVSALSALGEEAGWRGWLHRELGPLGFWRSSLLTGAIWGIWQAPLALQGRFHPEHPVVGALLCLAGCLALSPLLAWVRERSGSAFSAAVFQGTLNAAAGLPLLLVAHLDDRLVGVLGLSGLLIHTGASVVLWVVGRPKRR